MQGINLITKKPIIIGDISKLDYELVKKMAD